MPLQLGTSSAALDHTIKGTASSKKKLEIDIRTDGVRPPKKLRSRKDIVEALENQEFPRPLVSGKAFTRKPRILGTIDNQSSHAMEESKNCSSTEITHSSGDCNKLVVEEGVDRELNKEDIENVVNAGIIAPCVHSLKCTGDKDGKLSDSEFLIVEGTGERSTMDLCAHRSLAVPPGATAAAVQPCSGTTTQQHNEMQDAEHNSITTPEPSLALPFKKNSALWREFESMEIFTKISQNPHFSPLILYEDKKREEVALLKMTKYAFFVERIPKLTIRT